jgi:hypothetical protein
MNSGRRQFIAASLLASGAFSAPARAQGKTEPSDQPRTVSLRGRVICYTEELQKPYQVIPDCEARGHVYTLKTGDAGLYPLLPVDTAAAAWMDERYRQRELQVTARLFPNTNFIEVVRFQSWRDGRLHDLYYFCDVCSITTHKPGPCECCQDPVQFRETPAADNAP